MRPGQLRGVLHRDGRLFERRGHGVLRTVRIALRQLLGQKRDVREPGLLERIDLSRVVRRLQPG